jgi:coenzyme F420-reducing hydrogenase alpha subunit
MNEGSVVSSNGLRIPADQFEQEFTEIQVPHSTAHQAVRRQTGRSYLLGPLARVNLNRGLLSPTARSLADEIAFESPCRNPYRGIVARALEVVHAYEEALSILKESHATQPASVPYSPKAGSGCAATEAPRGLLYHRYDTAADGTLAAARIIPPTSQNQRQIESDLRTWLSARLDSGADRELLARGCEQLVRAYDPCISCSTHFLNVRWEDAGCDDPS